MENGFSCTFLCAHVLKRSPKTVFKKPSKNHFSVKWFKLCWFYPKMNLYSKYDLNISK